MSRCGCAGSACGCGITAGAGVTVTGVGSVSNPFVINATAAVLDIHTVFQVDDTDTLDLTLLGSGTALDPFILSGVPTMVMTDLSDVDDPDGPSAGEVPVWVGGGGGHWEFQAPPGSSGVMAPVARSNVSGAVNISSALVDEPVTIRYNLTGDTNLTIADGVPGQAYMCYLDVIGNSFTLEVAGGDEFAGVNTVTHVVIPIFWSGEHWFPQWQPGAGS